MSSIGQIIRQERRNRKMKQSELAEGICSASHLSKIESNTTVPSDEVIKLLLKRLNVELEEVTNDEEDQLILDLSTLYKDGILHRNQEHIRAYLQNYTGKKIHFKQLHNFYAYNLYMFRLFTVLDEDIDDLTPFVEALNVVKDQFDDKQKFIFHLNVGIYYYLKLNYTKALTLLESSLQLINKLKLEDWELADFHNIIAISYLTNGEYFRAVNCAEKSLNFYRDNLFLERAIDCYITVGIAQKRLLEYKKAETNFTLGLKLATSLNSSYYTGIIHQNLGALYAIKGNQSKAIEHYHLSLNCKELSMNSDGYALTVLSIIQEYSKKENPIQVIRWCDKGLDFIETMKEKNRYFQTYSHHFTIYKALHSLNEDLEMILTEAIGHFEESRDYRHVYKYSIVLGDYLHKNNKFKAAGDYYKKANKTLLKQKNISKWEDL